VALRTFFYRGNAHRRLRRPDTEQRFPDNLLTGKNDYLLRPRRRELNPAAQLFYDWLQASSETQ